MDLSHWTTILGAAVTTLAGLVWMLVKTYYQAKNLRREAQIADAEARVKVAEADVEVAKAEAEVAKAETEAFQTRSRYSITDPEVKKEKP